MRVDVITWLGVIQSPRPASQQCSAVQCSAVHDAAAPQFQMGFTPVPPPALPS
ncbi:MAG: hypothetical protein ACI8RD_000600 [Bacillariaceae sp.]|jgi:hypothetical protein